MGRVVIEEHEREIVKQYLEGKSPADLMHIFPYKRTTIKQVVKRAGVLRGQSEAAIFAIVAGKKDRAIRALIESARTTNRFNPLKGNPGFLSSRWKVNRGLLKQKRNVFEEKAFYKRVLEAKNYRCEITGGHDRLSVHHVKPVWKYPLERYNPDNCVVIRKDIHKLFHRMYGFKGDETAWRKFIMEDLGGSV